MKLSEKNKQWHESEDLLLLVEQDSLEGFRQAKNQGKRNEGV